MPRIAAPVPKRQPNGKWLLDVSAKVSETGTRKRLWFETKKEAELEAFRLKDIREQWGAEAAGVSASLAQDAKRAQDLLEGRNVSLVQVAREWLAAQEQKEASCTFAELWKAYLEMKEGNISDAYLKDLERYGKHLQAELGPSIVSEINGPQIETAIRKRYKTPTQFMNVFRTLRPAFSFALRRSWCQNNPCDAVERPRRVKGRPCVLSVEQALRLLQGASTDFRGDQWDGKMLDCYRLDCRGSEAAIAVALFAGLRPKELERLTWDLVELEEGYIHITTAIAKTRSTRTIPISENLAEWLQLHRRFEGKVVPSGWANKIKALRHYAKVSDMQDVMRHSFASYHLALHNDLNALQAAMGHNCSTMILDHYRAVVKKKDAERYWNLRPALELAEVVG